ncbi:hypothetical protein AGMMS49545_15260 [Betaproteobacteria bacterium]|nr:hypothetical protein AGMMS49545_15110 [Betaproteobacteria bacterium]GHT94253.1 hypothetical protein AGMMS49545_15260 [Betaproteobacteria bacterium]GHU15092.1 hypothetical protein FACS189441_6250 [Betaproteobacteria bacterium]GHU44857.1 hypothetical protein AGMMS50289_14250 [Betaproteobacteria bacterium]
MAQGIIGVEAKHRISLIPLGRPDSRAEPKIEFGIPIKVPGVPCKIVTQIYASAMKGTHIFIISGDGLPTEKMQEQTVSVKPPQWAYLLGRKLFLFWVHEAPLKSMADETIHSLSVAQYVIPSEWEPGTVFDLKQFVTLSVTGDYADIVGITVAPMSDHPEYAARDDTVVLEIKLINPGLFIDRVLPPEKIVNELIKVTESKGTVLDAFAAA